MIDRDFYLQNREKKRYSETILTFGPGISYTVEDLKERLEEVEKNVSDKEDVDIWIDYYNVEQGEYEFDLKISWVDIETEEDFERRMLHQKYLKQNAVESLKRLIKNNKEEAVEIIKDLGLI